MIAPKYPENEKLRQLALEKYQLIDTLPQESYDNITALISHICDTPISLVTLLDKNRNFIKSHHGMPIKETTRDVSFCGHAINSEEQITIIEDSRKDERFHDNPLVTEHQAVFYAGAPLVDSEGYKLGNLCVYDTKPRKLTEAQKNAMIAMSKQVINLFEQHYQNLKLVQLGDKLKKRNEDLKKFAKVVSHDLKSPLANIISLTELLEDENKENLDNESKQYIDYLKNSSYSLKDYVDGLLKFYKSDELAIKSKETIAVDELTKELIEITDPEHNTNFNITGNTKHITINKSALMQVLINLVTNAIKYNSKSETKINIDLLEDDLEYKLSVNDNGNGIPEDYLNKIFELFEVVGVEDKNGNIGTGIGLATTKKIINNLGGEITVSSKLGEGSTFSFSVPKFTTN